MVVNTSLHSLSYFLLLVALSNETDLILIGHIFEKRTYVVYYINLKNKIHLLLSDLVGLKGNRKEELWGNLSPLFRDKSWYLL